MRAGSGDDRRRLVGVATAALTAVAAVALAAAGCRRAVSSSLDRDFPRDLSSLPTLDAPAGPRGADLDLQWEWRAATARQRVRDRDAPWVFRRFPDLVVLDGEAHRSFLQLPSRDGSASLVAFRVRIPAATRLQLVSWTAIAPKVAARSDGVDAAIGVADADRRSPDDVALAWERVDGGDPQRWRPWMRDLSAFAGRTVWIVFGSRDRGSRVADSLLWGDARVLDASPPPVAIDLGAPRGARRRMDTVPWSAATFFKTYSLFSDEATRWLKPEWVRVSFPWLRSLRFLSALGANWGPTLAEHPEEGGPTASWESPLAKRYEFFTGSAPAPIAERFSWEAYDRVNAAAAASGLALHFNMSGAPEAFTGDRGMYRNYHVNELAIVDLPAWQTYVDVLFGHLAAQPWFPDATVSFFNEPNCVWTEFDGTTRKVGFQGDAAAYARQYAATWQAMKRWVPPDRVHLGPWVLELDAPVLDSPLTYIHAIRDAFTAVSEPPPRWDAFSFNLYETPQITLEHFMAAKLGFARALVRRAVPERTLRINIDEFGVHPLVADAFQQATGGSVHATRWENSWQAEMLAILARERVATAASWLPSYMASQPNALRAYLPYFALSQVAGAIRYTVADGAIDATSTSRPADAAAPEVWINVATRNASRIGSMTSTGRDGAVLAAVWRYPRFLIGDARAAVDGLTPVEVRLPAVSSTWHVRVLGYEDQLTDALGGHQTQLRFKAFPQVAPLRQVELDTGGSFTLPMAAGDVYLIEATPG